MAGAQGQPERQIAGRGSDRQRNYAEPLAKAAGRRPPSGQQGLLASPLLPQALTIPEPPLPGQAVEGKEEGKDWGEDRGAGTGSWGAACSPGFWGESFLLPRLTGEGFFFGSPVSSRKKLFRILTPGDLELKVWKGLRDLSFDRRGN